MAELDAFWIVLWCQTDPSIPVLHLLLNILLSKDTMFKGREGGGWSEVIFLVLTYVIALVMWDLELFFAILVHFGEATLCTKIQLHSTS